MKIAEHVSCPEHGRKFKPKICDNCAVIVKYFRQD
jgi:hypothetical protein